MRAWEQAELEEQIGQAALLIKKLLVTPEDCKLRDVAENWLKDHSSYISEEPSGVGYDVSLLDGDESKLPF